MMDNHVIYVNKLDDAGKPAGGYVRGKGIDIDWQNGPLGRPDGPTGRAEPNGAFVETVIHSAEQRLSWYNASGFGCEENEMAIAHLQKALVWLNKRTARREFLGIEGTHTPDPDPTPTPVVTED